MQLWRPQRFKSKSAKVLFFSLKKQSSVEVRWADSVQRWFALVDNVVTDTLASFHFGQFYFGQPPMRSVEFCQGKFHLATLCFQHFCVAVLDLGGSGRRRERPELGREGVAPKGGPEGWPRWVGGGGRVPNFCIVSFDRPHFVLVEFRNERE